MRGRGGAAIWGAALIGQAALIGAMGLHGAAIGADAATRGVPGHAGAGRMDRMGWKAASVAGGSTIALHRKLVRVRIETFAFRPARLVVSVGTRIVWTNGDSDPHTVDSVSGIWRSEALDTDGTFGRVFGKVGSFAYYCSIHPFMHGVVVVRR